MQLELNDQFVGVALAVALGLLIGAEREWAGSKTIGVRTMTLVAMIGAIVALLAEPFGAWLVGAGLIAVALLVAVRLWLEGRREPATGNTTATAALVAYLIGVLAASGRWPYAVALAGVVTLMLHWKEAIHGLIERLGEQDFEIIARFVLIALVVLPLLPDETFGPYDVFNPFESWLLVVLIVALNLVGYVAFRFAGTDAGAWLGGLVGGMISSTATTVSYSGLSRQHRSLGPVATLVILVASAVVYARVIVELMVVSPALIPHAAWPMALFGAFLLVEALVVYRWVRRRDVELPAQRNPAQFLAALTFGVVYVVVLYAVAIARDFAGDDAIYAVALISGLTDVDALTLSVGQLHARGELNPDHAWRAIFIATLANLAFKTGAAVVLGSKDLRRWMLGAGVTALAIGATVVVLWT